MKDMQEEMQQNERSLKAEVRHLLVFILEVILLPYILVNFLLSNLSAFR